MRNFSGKFLLRLPKPLHRELSFEAEKKGVSLNRFLVQRLSENQDKPAENSKIFRVLAPIQQILKQKFGDSLIGIVLFGSQIEGVAKENSDLDVLIILEKNVPLKRALYSWWDNTIHWNEGEIKEINPHFVHQTNSVEEAGGIWFEIALCHHILWEKRGKISLFLRKLLTHIQNGKITRLFSNGHPYWAREEEEGAKQNVG